MVELAKAAAADRSAALPLERIERSARVYLARNPKIDGNGEQWAAQHDMMVRLAAGGRLSVAIGAAGAGKSTILAPLVDAWKAERRQVYGATIAWRQAGELKKAGIEESVSLSSFLFRVETTGQYTLDRNSVIVIDEVSLIGTKQMLDLLRIRDRTGAQIVMVGDPKQCQAIEGAGSIELLREALGAESVPEVLTSIRQKSERELEIASLWREGKATEALEMKRQDGTAILVAGGREETVKRVTHLWFERTEAHRGDPNYKIIITAPTNADTREIGAAIREDLRARGQLGKDLAVLDAGDGRGERYQLPVAIGDKVRLFDRVHDAKSRKVLASNGEVAEIRAVTRDGIVLRNSAGTEGLVAWKKIQKKDGPVRLSYGYAMTIDTAQGITEAENIHAMLGGSQAVSGFKAYTAGSRHEHQYWLIVDDASERREIAGRAMLGMKPQISEPEVWQNVSENLSRQPLKQGALAMLREEHQPRARLGP
jgi:ATP-dependent exoDNAse (exonuclease V) alpha subunit